MKLELAKSQNTSRYETTLQEFLFISLQVKFSVQRLPQIQALVNNVTARLEPFQYLHYQGLYTALSLRLLGEELSQLETDISSLHSQSNTAQTQKLSKEVQQKQTSIYQYNTAIIICCCK